jgi:hypothetical protein
VEAYTDVALVPAHYRLDYKGEQRQEKAKEEHAFPAHYGVLIPRVEISVFHQPPQEVGFNRY